MFPLASRTFSQTMPPSWPALRGDRRQRGAARTDDDVVADLLVVAQTFGLDRVRSPQQGHAAARQNAFFDRGTRGVQRVFDAGLLLLHFALGRGADVDLGHAAGQLGQPLFELLAIVVAGRVLDLAADLVDAGLDLGALAGAFDDRRVVLVDDDLLGPAEIRELQSFRA